LSLSVWDYEEKKGKGGGTWEKGTYTDVRVSTRRGSPPNGSSQLPQGKLGLGKKPIDPLNYIWGGGVGGGNQVLLIRENEA